MKTAITVKTREEGQQLVSGLDDPQVRAFVRIIGVLRQLPNDQTRVLVLNFVTQLNELREVRTNGRDADSAGNF